jgi:hypothetical protein
LKGGGKKLYLSQFTTTPGAYNSNFLFTVLMKLGTEEDLTSQIFSDKSETIFKACLEL